MPLSEAVLRNLTDRPRLGEYVFTTTGTTPFSGYSRSKQRLDSRIGLTDWTLHDLRRTFVTRLYEMNIPPHIVEATVNHVSSEAKGGVAGVYNKAQHMPERKAALDRWAVVIDCIGQGGNANIIAPLKEHKYISA